MGAHDPSPTEPERVRPLYGVPLADFVKSRDALARTMRAEGDRPAAARTAALRRPSAGAWALNQVVRRDEPAVRELLETAAAMRAATEQALAGDARALRALGQRERDAVRRVVDAALEALRDAGRSPTDQVAQKIATTARSALADEILGEQLRVGTLTDDIQQSGFGLEALAFTPPSAPTEEQEREDEPDRRPDDADREREQVEREQHEREQHEREATRLEAAAERLITVAAHLEHDAQHAEDAARLLRAEADAAAIAAAEAKTSARRARVRVDIAR